MLNNFFGGRDVLRKLEVQPTFFMKVHYLVLRAGVTVWLTAIELNSFCSKNQRDLIHFYFWKQLLGCAVMLDPFQTERTKTMSGNVLTLNSIDDCGSD